MTFTNDIGRDLRGISYFPEEKEWLLTYGTKLKIGAVSDYNFEYLGEQYKGKKIILEQCPQDVAEFQKDVMEGLLELWKNSDLERECREQPEFAHIKKRKYKNTQTYLDQMKELMVGDNTDMEKVQECALNIY